MRVMTDPNWSEESTFSYTTPKGEWMVLASSSRLAATHTRILQGRITPPMNWDNTHVRFVCGESKNNHNFLPYSMLINMYDISLLEAAYPSLHLNPFPLHPTLSKTIVCPQGVLNNKTEHATHWMICCICVSCCLQKMPFMSSRSQH